MSANQSGGNEKKLAEAWAKRSKEGELCGMIGCFIPPERFCSCKMSYCTAHFSACHLKEFSTHTGSKAWDESWV